MNLRYLGMPERSAKDWLARMQQSDYLNLGLDSYNVGDAVQLLESRVATILGTSNALFFPKGMTAQYVALKVSEESHSNNAFALHPLSHICLLYTSPSPRDS